MNRPLAKLLLRWLLLVVALGLLIAAVWAGVSQVDWPRLSEISPVHAMLLAGSVLVNLLLAGGMFWVVTLSFDASPRVPLSRMMWLIMASALFNFLPLRPGLVGRAAILRTHHQLPVRQSVLTLLVVLAVGCAVTLLVGLLAWLITNPLLLGIMILASTLVLALISGPIASRLLHRPVVMAWLWVPLRVADAMVAGFRLWLAFEIIGVGIDYRQALIAGAAGLLVAMVGLTPNGLGLREWIIALFTQAISSATWETGLAASLVDRGMETLVVIAAGLIALWMLKTLWRNNTAIPSRELPPGDLPPGE